MALIRVYNLESIMTESDDAATRKSILGYFHLETHAGAAARVAVLLLGLVAAAAALLEVASAFLPPASTSRLFTPAGAERGLPLGFAWAMLAATSRRRASCKPASRCWGVGVLAELILYPIGSLIQVIGSDRIEAVPLGVLMLIGLIWYVLACANIWRSALDSGTAVASR